SATRRLAELLQVLERARGARQVDGEERGEGIARRSLGLGRGRAGRGVGEAAAIEEDEAGAGGRRHRADNSARRRGAAHAEETAAAGVEDRAVEDRGIDGVAADAALERRTEADLGEELELERAQRVGTRRVRL